jgi:hypothetical protein
MIQLIVPASAKPKPAPRKRSTHIVPGSAFITIENENSITATNNK